MRCFSRLVAACLVLGVAGCGLLGEETFNRPCPHFLLLGNAGDLTQFRPGPGRDVTDVDFRAAIVDFGGTCTHTKNEVDATFRVEIEVRRGPANRSREANFQYFVAIPRFHPSPAGKRVFPVKIKFEDNRSRLIYRDEVSLKIPLKKGEVGANYDVYLGFQLDPDQLEYNRRRRAR